MSHNRRIVLLVTINADTFHTLAIWNNLCDGGETRRCLVVHAFGFNGRENNTDHRAVVQIGHFQRSEASDLCANAIGGNVQRVVLVVLAPLRSAVEIVVKVYIDRVRIEIAVENVRKSIVCPAVARATHHIIADYKVSSAIYNRGALARLGRWGCRSDEATGRFKALSRLGLVKGRFAGAVRVLVAGDVQRVNICCVLFLI